MVTEQIKEIDSLIGSNLRMIRGMAGLNQHKLGTAVGVTFQQIQKYEQGKNRVAASRLYLMAQALDIPITSFFANDDYYVEKKSLGEESTGFTMEVNDLVKSYMSIKDGDVRANILTLIKSFLK